MRLIAAHDYRRERWKNGLGWTSEIARGRVPAPMPRRDAVDTDADDWDWRLSIADIDRDCAFSVFPGIDRSLRLLAGQGMRLRFDDGQVVVLDPERPQLEFAGERALECALLDGPTRDFNAMWRRDRIDARMAARQLAGDTGLAVGPRETVAVHALAGRATAGNGQADCLLADGDTLIAGGASEACIRLQGEASLLIVRFAPVAGR